MEITGKIDKIGEVQQVSDKFKKREVWVETQEDYPQFINLQISQDKADQFNGKEGEVMKFSINIRGRKWTNPEGQEKCFNSIEAWRWEAVGNSSQPQQQPTEGKDDLPF